MVLCHSEFGCLPVTVLQAKVSIVISAAISDRQNQTMHHLTEMSCLSFDLLSTPIEEETVPADTRPNTMES